MEWVCQDRDTAGLANGRHGVHQVHISGYGRCNPEREDMASAAGYLHTGDDVERVALFLFIGPKRRIEGIMVGDGDDIEMRLVAGDVVKQVADGACAVAGGGVHVQVGITVMLGWGHVASRDEEFIAS